MIFGLVLTILCFVVLLHTYWGYAISLKALARIRKPVRIQPDPAATAKPSISIVFSIYNEASILAEKLENCLNLNYPSELIEIVAASDMSDDGSDEILRQYEPRGVRWVRQEKRLGKNLALNRLAPMLKGDIWVFTDANTMFERDAIEHLVAPFADPRVGLVCGELTFKIPLHRQNAKQHRLGSLEAIFWRADQRLKRAESRFGRLSGANGAIFAIRKSGWLNLDPNSPNDFIQCALIAAGGALTLYEPRARATETPSERVSQEFHRRVRIISTGIQALAKASKAAIRGGQWLLLYEIVCRKWLRRLQPIFLLGLFAGSAFLLGYHSGRMLFVAQAIFYALCLLSGVAYRAGARRTLVLAPFYFLALNAAAFVALFRFARGKQEATWTVHRPSSADRKKDRENE